MRPRSTLVALLMGSAFAGSGPGVLAQTAPSTPAPSSTAAPAATTPATPAAAIPPQVKQGLDRMGTALRALGAFKLKADVTTEDVLESGQKLQSSAVMTFDANRPNRLLVDIDSSRKQRRLYYDGKSLTVFSPRTGYYATVAAPPTIHRMITEIASKYGVETPLADLFEWGTSDFPVDRIQSAVYAGSDRIRGQVCDQYAFRQPGVDWQVWVSKSDPALPCKMVIVNTEDPAQPEMTSLFEWSTNVQFSDAQFSFVPPKDSHRIVLGQLGAVATKEANK